MDHDSQQPDGGGPARFIGAVFGLAFLGVGVTVLGFLWLTPFDQFGSPPLFFRIFGSFVAIPFVAMGGGTAYAMINGKPLSTPIKASRRSQNRQTERNRTSATSVSNDGYSCSNCAAPLSNGSDVSPHGDVKCKHCGCWFNVHS